MQIGMLWYDNSARTSLLEKAEKAADYYWRKYGHVPDLCMVHPSMLISGLAAPDKLETTTGKLTLRPDRAIMPGHLWIGREQQPVIQGA